MNSSRHPSPRERALRIHQCPRRVIRVGLATYRRPPLYPYKQTSLPCVGMSQMCQSRKSGPLRMGTTDHQLLDKRKSDPKRRATMIAIPCRYQPVVRLDNGAHDGQPHAHTFRLAGEKRLEDLR